MVKQHIGVLAVSLGCLSGCFAAGATEDDPRGDEAVVASEDELGASQSYFWQKRAAAASCSTAGPMWRQVSTATCASALRYTPRDVATFRCCSREEARGPHAPQRQ